MRYVGEIIGLVLDEAEGEVDDDGLRWQSCIRRVKLIGYREGNSLIRELPDKLEDKIIDQRIRVCVSEGYEWHLAKKIDKKPVLITVGEDQL